MSTHRTAAYENQVLLRQTGGAAWTMPTTLYLGLLDGTNTEPTIDANYARVAVAAGASGFGAPSAITNGREIANLAAYSFTQNNSGVSHGTMTQWAIFDAATGGTEWWRGPLDANIVYDDGVQPEVAIGVVKIQLLRTDAGGAIFHGATDYLMDLELNHLRGNASWPQPTFVHGLLTAITDEGAGTVTEVTGGTYARQAVTWNTPDAEGTTVANGRATTNSAGVDHGSNAQSSESLVGWGLHDGTDWCHIARVAVTWPAAGTIRWPAGDLYVSAR